jgi:hypothetical protein
LPRRSYRDLNALRRGSQYDPVSTTIHGKLRHSRSGDKVATNLVASFQQITASLTRVDQDRRADIQSGLTGMTKGFRHSGTLLQYVHCESQPPVNRSHEIRDSAERPGSVFNSRSNIVVATTESD